MKSIVKAQKAEFAQQAEFRNTIKMFNADGSLHATAKRQIQNSLHGVTGTKIYTDFWKGSGRHISLSSSAYYIKRLLDLGGYAYKTGNDAPRKGAAGNYIEVSKKAMQYLTILAR